MLEHYDEFELLGLIEDTLDPARAASLLKRLEADPEAHAMVEAMQRDRQLLKREPEPALPADFAAMLEPMLVRPMLMDSLFDDPVPAAEPGQQRRAHRRQRMRRTVRRLALAALVAIVASAGLWTGYQAMPPLTRTQLAANESVDARARIEQPAASEPLALAADATVHHHAPPPLTARPNWLMHDQLAAITPTRANGAIAAEVALVLDADNAADGERLLTDVIARLNEPVALVQNFSYEEAVRLEQAWLVAGPHREIAPPAVAGDAQVGEAASASSRMRELANRAAAQQRSLVPNEQIELSSQLVGPREHAAPFEQQLAFSSRGATHTISLPASRVQDLLAELARSSESRLSLQQLPGEGETYLPTGPSQWVINRPAVQQILDELRSSGSDALVHLPVIIRRP